MSDKYCPAGKCECDNVFGVGDMALCVPSDKPQIQIIELQQCPWPSRIVPGEAQAIEPIPGATYPIEAINAAYRNGVQWAVQRCREAGKLLAHEFNNKQFKISTYVAYNEAIEDSLREISKVGEEVSK
jgi:hypothetical protein